MRSLVALPQMVHPGVLVDAFRHLQEEGEVLGAQLQLPFLAAEDERLVTEVAGGVLALPGARTSARPGTVGRCFSAPAS